VSLSCLPPSRLEDSCLLIFPRTGILALPCGQKSDLYICRLMFEAARRLSRKARPTVGREEGHEITCRYHAGTLLKDCRGEGGKRAYRSPGCLFAFPATLLRPSDKPTPRSDNP
jgi:hypothetical protein